MAKAKEVMSIAVDKITQDCLKKFAKAGNVSVSKLIRDLVDTYLLQDKKMTVVHHDPEHIPIVLKIPVELKGDREAIQSWLRIRTTAIIERLAVSIPTDIVKGGTD